MRALIIGLVLQLASCTLCSAQEQFDAKKVGKSVRKLANQIAEGLTVDSRDVGRAPVTTDQYRKYTLLAATATEKELIALTHHSSPAVRSYACLGLYKIKSRELLNILREHESDTAVVTTRSGCLVGQPRVVDYIFFKFLYQQRANTYSLIPADTLLIERVRAAMWDRHERNDVNIERQRKSLK